MICTFFLYTQRKLYECNITSIDLTRFNKIVDVVLHSCIQCLDVQ